MKPAQIDYEMRRFVFGSTENVIRLLNLFAEFFEHSEQEFDLKNTYFKAFLNVRINNKDIYDCFYKKFFLDLHR
jgi:hypothetical protein